MTESATKTENIAEVKESGHEIRDTASVFQPEVLAFCCEH